MKRVRDRKHAIKCLWILPLKWGIAMMTIVDCIIAILLVLASIFAFIREQKNKAKEVDPTKVGVINSVFFFLFLTDGTIIILFAIKCFYGLAYFVDILCPPSRSKAKDGRILTEDDKKIMIVKK